MTGFSISGIEPSTTMDGFIELYKHGFIEFVDENGIQLLGTVNEKAWYKITPKFKEHLADNSAQAITTPNPEYKKLSKEQRIIQELAEKTHDDKRLETVDFKDLPIVYP